MSGYNEQEVSRDTKGDDARRRTVIFCLKGCPPLRRVHRYTGRRQIHTLITFNANTITTFIKLYKKKDPYVIVIIINQPVRHHHAAVHAITLFFFVTLQIIA